jgi:hypothetical protein
MLTILGMNAAALQPNPMLQKLFAINNVLVGMSLFNLVLTMFWCSRANRTLADRMVGELENGPALAGFWFIIPIACYFKPYGVVLEIFKASRAPDSWRNTKEASIVGWWWGAYIVTNVTALLTRIAGIGASGDTSQFSMNLSVLVFIGLMLEHILRLIIITRVMGWLNSKRLIQAQDVF